MLSSGRPTVSAVCRSAASEQITAAVPPDIAPAVVAESAAFPDMLSAVFAESTALLPDTLAASRSASLFMRSCVQEIIPSIVCIRA